MTPITTSTRRQIREWALKRGERYRITRDGEVHLYGTMPNSIVTGWWYAGPVWDVLRRIEQDNA